MRIMEALTRGIKAGLSRPIYLRVDKERGGEVSIKQIEFLTPAQLAELTHVSPRTVYGWIERAQKNGLKYYKPPGSSGIIFEINETLDWIMTAQSE
jgi:hypothetical protein